jgi:hypothetical protein
MENVLEKHWTHRYSKVFVHYYLEERPTYWTNERIDGKDLGPDPFLHS